MVRCVNGWSFSRVGEWMSVGVSERVRSEINVHEVACTEGWVCRALVPGFDWWVRSYV